jgi:hypothetical protein
MASTVTLSMVLQILETLSEFGDARLEDASNSSPPSEPDSLLAEINFSREKLRTTYRRMRSDRHRQKLAKECIDLIK